jgi:hypothetical protein
VAAALALQVSAVGLMLLLEPQTLVVVVVVGPARAILPQMALLEVPASSSFGTQTHLLLQ